MRTITSDRMVLRPWTYADVDFLHLGLTDRYYDTTCELFELTHLDTLQA